MKLPCSDRGIFRFLAIATLVALAVTLAVALPGVSANGDEDRNQAPPLPEKTELNYSNLGSHLSGLAEGYEAGQTTERQAASETAINSGGSIAVTIYLNANVDAVVRFLEDNGGDPRNVGQDYIEAYVPVPLLGQLSEQPGVIRVREIIPPQPAYGDVTSQGVGAHLATAWHEAGITGESVKVGVIDIGFYGLQDLRGTELPAKVVGRCYTDIGVFTSNLSACDNDEQSKHGTAVAETVMDIAPGATLYIANSPSMGDLREATEWMSAEGVQVINYSVVWIFDGPGDGTSPFSNSPLNTVNWAADNGIIWVNAAGNTAESTWFKSGSSLTIDSDGLVEFALLDISNCFVIYPGMSFTVQLRWDDDWGGATRDLDLLLWDTRIRAFVLASRDPQSGEAGHFPLEILLGARYTGATETVGCLVVVQYSGSQPDWVQLQDSSGILEFEYYTKSGSIGNPAESANSGLLAVGATHYWDTHTIAGYSSRGPTPDGRVKPDIVGTACGETASYELIDPRFYDGNDCWFPGTSQASPHVAGLAALVRQKFPNYTPQQVAQYLKDNAAGRGATGPDYTWGHGFAVLPQIGGCSNNPGLAADCAMLLAARDTLAGTGTLNWSANAPITTWDGVTVGGSPLRATKLRLSDKGLTGEIPSELGSLANLEELYLWGNELTGTIPAELGSLANLKELSLTRNQLAGEIPPELGSLTSLEILALGGNQLTGEIPSELGSLANLEELYLWGNELTGTIPAELGSLANLVQLELAENQLTGEIPTQLGSLANLEELYLWGNELTGTITHRTGQPRQPGRTVPHAEPLERGDTGGTGEPQSSLKGLLALVGTS